MKKKKIQQLLDFAQKLIEEEKISEALEYLNSLDGIDKYIDEHKAIFYTRKSEIQRMLGDFPKAYETAKKGMQFANKIERGIEVVDTFLNMARIIHFMGKNKECSNLLKESFEILNNLTQISEKDRKRRMGLYYFYKANNFVKLGEIMKCIEYEKVSIDFLEKWGPQTMLARVYAGYGLGLIHIGKYNEALNFMSKSQKIGENKESPQYRMPKLLCLFGTGIIFYDKGDLQLALESIKKGTSLSRKYNKPMFRHMGLNALGKINYELGKWDQAIKYYKEAINLAENFESREVYQLSNLHNLYINMGDVCSSPQIFHKVEQYRDKEKDNPWFNLFYRFNKALLLKKSKRTRDLGAAQEIFKTIVNEEVINLEMTQNALLNLCEMLLEEFNNTKNVEALEEFSLLLEHLREIAKKRNSSKTLAETYILDSKLSMINFDLKKARQSLTKAQQIAEKYGLKWLAIKISNEHDNLLQNLEVWEQMKKENVSIPERLEKIEINDQILTMLKKNPVEIPETSPESPILLLIMSNSGIPLYTKIFNNEWKIQEDIFSGFLSAFNSFSDEIFSEGLDRANFGKFTILMAGMPPFMVCYAFEGQSFLAQQKFSKFKENLQKSEQIWKKITSSNKTGLIIRDDPSEGIGKLVKTIFEF